MKIKCKIHGLVDGYEHRENFEVCPGCLRLAVMMLVYKGEMEEYRKVPEPARGKGAVTSNDDSQ